MKTQAAQVASTIKKHLKQHGIDCRVKSDNFSGGDSVNVYIHDVLPATLAMIKDYCSQFEYGHFDGMTDCYEYSNSRGDIPQTKYLFVNPEYSDELHQECWKWLIDYYQFNDAPADYKQAGNYHTDMWYSYGSQLIRDELITGERGFWRTKKIRLAA